MTDTTGTPASVPRGGAIDWAVFFALGTMWGSSYLFIKIGVETITPFTLVAFRLLIGATFLVLFVGLRGLELPRRPRMYGHLFVLSIFSVVLPFSLITWAEQSVTSSLASILTATVPLFVILIAPFVLRDEGITAYRVVGLLIGFAGVVILTGGPGGGGDLLPQLALLGAACSYAIGGVYGRRTVTGLPPAVAAVCQVSFAFVLSASLALLFERPFELEYPLRGIGALLWLGLIGTGLAYLAFFRLLKRIGATRTSLVAYVMPAVGIALGALVANEPVTVPMIVGTLLVIGGILLVNLHATPAAMFRRTFRQRTAP